MPNSADHRARARRALREVAALRRDVTRTGAATFRTWRSRIKRRAFAADALNLSGYLALRRHDIRALQRQLMVLGASSLGRLEGRVLVSLDAVAVALAALAGGKANGIKAPTDRRFFRGEARLAANAAEIFGPERKGRAGRIMVTLGTGAADDPAVALDLAKAGADAFRINCAHDGKDAWRRMVRHVRRAERHVGRKLSVLMDIGGPKVRTGAILAPGDRRRLGVGDALLLARELDAGRTDFPFQATCEPAEILDRIKVGDQASIDDGRLQGRIAAAIDGGFVVEIERGKLAGIKLRPEKGLNFPTADLALDPLTDKDREDLAFIVRHADIVGHSFVQSAEHVAALQRELARLTRNWRRIAVVGKIETPRAVRNLPEIVVQGAGQQPFAVMIARGDLAVEMGFERVAEMQEEILWLCEAARVPVIWATQVLEELVKKGLPSRGEMSDVVMASRAECVMLNKGPNVAAAVGVLDRVLRRMGEHQVKKTPTLRALHAWSQHTAGGE